MAWWTFLVLLPVGTPGLAASRKFHLLAARIRHSVFEDACWYQARATAQHSARSLCGRNDKIACSGSQHPSSLGWLPNICTDDMHQSLWSLRLPASQDKPKSGLDEHAVTVRTLAQRTSIHVIARNKPCYMNYAETSSQTVLFDAFVERLIVKSATLNLPLR
jgi:hypothetical protein